jgi:hypothetical protein
MPNVSITVILGVLQMPEWALALMALVGSLGGLGAGYWLGYRNGRVCGELRALHVTLAEMRGPASRPHFKPARSLTVRVE